MEEDKINYKKAETKLLFRKEELFNSGNVGKWELSNEDQNIKFDFIKDKALLIPKMLPKVYHKDLFLINILSPIGNSPCKRIKTRLWIYLKSSL